MIRRLVLSSLLAFGAVALAWSTAEVPADGSPIVIDGFTPGATYTINVWGQLSYRLEGRATYDVHLDTCFDRSSWPSQPAQTFQNDFGIEMCGATAAGWGRLGPTVITFRAPGPRMVAWVAAPDHVQAIGSLTVQIHGGAGHVGDFHPYQLRHCILRRPLAEQPVAGAPVCFEFEIAYAYDPSSWRLASIDFDTCVLTEHGERSGWQVDPTFGGPHLGPPVFEPGNVWRIWQQLVPHGGDWYGCRSPQGGWPPSPLPTPAPPPTPAPTPPPSPLPVPQPRTPFDPTLLDPSMLVPYGAFWSNSCPWAFDGECDEPGIGTGVCAAGTDTFDCYGVPFDWSNSCPWAFDGECDEPGIGTGACLPGTDTFDCGFASFDWSNSCPWAFDGECDEPGIGTGVCLPGTDTFDCYGTWVGPTPPMPPAPPEPPAPTPRQVERRERTLDRCEVWSVSNSGGAEGTVDVWDISHIPDGAVFDLRFNARSEPDRYRIVYGGVEVYDSGWRGAASYGDDPRFAGGIAGPGQGEASDVFVKRAYQDMTVVVDGGTTSTVWDYRVRCRVP